MNWTVTDDTRDGELVPWGRVLNGDGQPIAHWEGPTQRNIVEALVTAHNAGVSDES